jgi:hypothetical protein
MLDDGLRRGGADEARKRLADFWKAAESWRRSAAGATRDT